MVQAVNRGKEKGERQIFSLKISHTSERIKTEMKVMC